VRLDIPSQTMAKKLDPLLKDAPGTFCYHPKVVSGIAQIQRFRRANIACPDFTTNLKKASEWVEAGALVFGRNSHHEKGLDIVAPNSLEWAKKDFWTKVIPAEREYRVHIFDGKLIHQSLKEVDQNAKPSRTDGLPIRNTSTGYRYNHNFNPPLAAVELAKCAVDELGYLWGAVDILEDRTAVPYVLEVNSAPGMGDATAIAYADAIKRYSQKVPSATR
jgi:hypothetical protein